MHELMETVEDSAKSYGILGEIQRSCGFGLSAKELGLAYFQMHILFMTAKSTCF